MLLETDPPANGPVERAQVVWQRARDLGSEDGSDQYAVALELVRTADHDPTAMVHALTIGRHRARENPSDASARAGVVLLAAAVDMLGAKPDR